MRSLGTLPSMRKAYQTDLSDAEWVCIQAHLPPPESEGRPRVHPLREILDAVSCIVRSGCAWRLLPHDDFPPWKTVHHYFFSISSSGSGASMAPGGRSSTRPSESGFASTPWTRCAPLRWYRRRLAIGEEHRCGRRGAWIRWRQADQGQETPHPGRYGGLLARGVKVHAANVFDRDGIKLLLGRTLMSCFHASGICCGWMPATTTARRRVRTGWRRSWAGVPGSSSVPGAG